MFIKQPGSQVLPRPGYVASLIAASLLVLYLGQGLNSYLIHCWVSGLVFFPNGSIT